MSSANFSPYRERSEIAALTTERDAALKHIEALKQEALAREDFRKSAHKESREAATAVTTVVFLALIGTFLVYGSIQLFHDRTSDALTWFAVALWLLALLRRLLGRRWAW